MFCKKCRADVGDVAYCPNCGTKTKAEKKKKKSRNVITWIVGGVILFSLLGGLASRQSDPPVGGSSSQEQEGSFQTSEDKMTQEELLEFDDKTWEVFKSLYNAHNDMVEAMTLYADGNASKLSFYEYCEKAEGWFGQVSAAIGFGGSEYEQNYLSAIRSMALEDQMAAKGLMKYLDSGKTSDLSEVNKHIEVATSAVSVIASNRGVLLVDAGLSDEEIQKRIDDSMEGME